MIKSIEQSLFTVLIASLFLLLLCLSYLLISSSKEYDAIYNLEKVIITIARGELQDEYIVRGKTEAETEEIRYKNK